jgi:hypothetical protein
MENQGLTAPAPKVADIFGDQIQVDGNWFHAERIFRRPASSFAIGDCVPELAQSNTPQKQAEPDEYVPSSLFRESGANATCPTKVAEYASAMAAYGGFGKFPMVTGRVCVIDHADVDRYEELDALGIAHELAYSRPLTRADVGRRIVHLENGHHRAHAAARHEFDIPVYDMELEEQSFGKARPKVLTATERAEGFLAAFEIAFKETEPSTGLEVTLRQYQPGEVTLDCIWSHAERRKGHANKAMHQLCELADEHGVDLHGTIHSLRYGELEGETQENAAFYGRLDEQGMNNAQLERWYAKFGFERKPGADPDNPDIVRPAGPAPSLKQAKNTGPSL